METVEVLKNKDSEYFDEIVDWVGAESSDELDFEFFDPDDAIFRNPATELRRFQKGIEKEYL